MRIYANKNSGVDTKLFKWHVFSSGRFESLEKDEALEEYQSQIASKYFVMNNDLDEVFVTDLKPDSCVLSDYYVFPENMAWTMAFTHEDGWLGPYFARHPKYETLNRINMAHLDKLKQIENAKKNGWC